MKYLEEWEKDARISDDLTLESLRIPQIHSKWMKFLFKEKKELVIIKTAYAKMKRLRWEHYNGTIDHEVLDKMGWEPFLQKILKPDLPMWLDADTELRGLKDQVTSKEDIISMIEQVIRQIVDRQWTIKNAIEWKKFELGL